MDLLDIAGIKPGNFDIYAKRNWGIGWSKNLETLNKAIADLNAGIDYGSDEYASHVAEPF